MRKFYAVIDTNVIVSSMFKSDSIPGKIVDMMMLGRIVPLLNEEILAEYVNVLTRNKFGFKDEEVASLLTSLHEKGLFLNRESTVEPFEDKDDIVFFEVCLSGRSTMDAYLVTGNLRHYPIRSYVVTPRQMLDIILSSGD